MATFMCGNLDRHNIYVIPTKTPPTLCPRTKVDEKAHNEARDL